jgi:ATP-dependent helicase HrpA
VIEVSGRTYPVEVRYRPVIDDAPDGGAPGGDVEADRDQIQVICDAVDELRAGPRGDILVFLSGEREIRDTADALKRMNLPDTEILPLYARLSTAEQHRVFQAHRGRRIVLATNVAETSLTVPGIKYVIDPGTARISRYSHRLKVQRLPIEPVSQASANQRKGRCGRTSDGICIRLYSEADFLSRPEYTDPEILRTNLASVILQMAAAGLGEIAAFPFIDAPDRRNIKDGVQLLEELGAFDAAGQDRPEGGRSRLTPLGRRLSQLPIDPRLARMVLEAERNGCVPEVMVIAAALSIQDPRERPVDKQQAADAKHARFVDKDSDFLGYLNLWRYLSEQQRTLSSSQFRRLCKAEFLNYLRVREWQDLYSQLRQAVGQPGSGKTGGGKTLPPLGEAAVDPKRIHLSLLAGLLSHIGLKDPEKHEYQGARGARFAIFPGSALFKKAPRWLMAAELVETSRLWGRVAAGIEPEWAESLAPHLVKRSYSEPHWEKNQGAVMAYEKVTLYGLPIVASRKVNYGRIDPQLSRELFIRHALVEGDWQTHHPFFQANRKLLSDVEDLEHRVRRRDILVDDETLFDFYDKRVGDEVVSARHFDTWWKTAGREQPDLLTFSTSMLINERAGGVSAEDYPDFWLQGGLRLRLTYQFEPGTEADGVTVHIPLPLLNQVSAEGFDWQVPGLREELVVALIRSLPKQVRRNFVPVPDFARAVLAQLSPDGNALVSNAEHELLRMTGVAVARADWQPDRVPDHLRMTFRVVDEQGQMLAQGKDLTALREQLKPQVRAAITDIAATAGGIERAGLREWSFGTLPRTYEQRRAGYAVRVYPALVDEGDSVAIRMLDTEAEQREAMLRGTRRLLRLGLPSAAKLVQGRLSNEAKLALSPRSGSSPHRTAVELLEDCADCAVDRLVAEAGGPVWDEEAFGKLRDAVRPGLVDAMLGVVTHVQPVLTTAYAIDRRLASAAVPALLPALTDIRAQLSALVYPGFVTATGWQHLPDLPRYLQAIERRLDKLPENPRRDRDWQAQVEAVQEAYRELSDTLPPGKRAGEGLRQIRWMMEELRVSYFAQHLGTRYPVSEKRIYRAMDDLEAS